jgi:urea transport system substrate-binding protein
MSNRLNAALVACDSSSPPPSGLCQDDTIKVGSCIALCTMAISETTLKDVMLMLIEKQNEAGGSCRVGAVVVDPPQTGRLCEKARELWRCRGRAVFGNWNSVSRNRSCRVC